MNLSDKIVDFAIETTPGPGAALTGVVEALVRLAVCSGVPNVEDYVHSQISMMFAEIAPQFRRELAKKLA